MDDDLIYRIVRIIMALIVCIGVVAILGSLFTGACMVIDYILMM